MIPKFYHTRNVLELICFFFKYFRDWRLALVEEKGPCRIYYMVLHKKCLNSIMHKRHHTYEKCGRGMIC